MDQSTLGSASQSQSREGPISSHQTSFTTDRSKHNSRDFSRGRGRGRGRFVGRNWPRNEPTTLCSDQQPKHNSTNVDNQPSTRIQNESRSDEINLPLTDQQQTSINCNEQSRTRGRRNRSKFNPGFQNHVGFGNNTRSQRDYRRWTRDEDQSHPSTSQAYGAQNSSMIASDVNSENLRREDRNKIVHRRFLRDRQVSNQDKMAPIEPEGTKNAEPTESQPECMICCDNIRRIDPIWYCTSCYNIFHLKCSIEWCNKSIKSRDEAITNSQYPSLGNSSNRSAQENQLPGRASSSNAYPDYRNIRQKSIEWPCPACRKVLHSRPGKYKCFCGKVIQPDVNRHLPPHSCGQMCGRKRPNADCPHSCNVICHPGRCNPCPLTSEKSCFCGKLSKEVKCTSQVGSCEQICGKPLTCGRHQCSLKCHDGSCEQCDEILIIECYCGAKKFSKRCEEHKKLGRNKMDDKFSCDRICDKLLDCGKHRCMERCHRGPNCGSCKLLSENLKSCPCGSKTIPTSILETRKTCTDPIPTCENKCNSQLICGPEKNRHRCQKKCHIGSCPPCKLKSTVKCECSMSSRTIECSMMFEKILDEQEQVIGFKQIIYTFKCETRCNIPKNCGKHRCQEKCCNANRNHDSRAHICNQICNKKLPCGTHNCKETCHPGLCGDCTNIGWSELTCHCGASVIYPPIPCGAKPPTCHRPCRRAHNCGHPVNHECHDDTERCAPCTLFVKKSCFCGADSKESVYCYLPGYSCGRTCKKLLSCRQHTCKKICHDGTCEVPNERNVIMCSQPCPKPRYPCKHPCNLPCHGKTPCLATNCSKAIEVNCQCGNRTERIECYKLSKDSENRNKMAMLSINRPNQDSVVIDIAKQSTCLKESSQDNSMQSMKLDCDDTCAVYKRNKALAEALDISQPNLKSSVAGEDPLKLIREATAQDYKFVAATYNSLAKLVKSAKESERRFIFLQFPPANKLRREVIHELAYHFNCTSESRDEEPEKYVIVRASRNKSCDPDFTIEQLLPADE